jgi:hypothetical protein
MHACCREPQSALVPGTAAGEKRAASQGGAGAGGAVLPWPWLCGRIGRCLHSSSGVDGRPTAVTLKSACDCGRGHIVCWHIVRLQHLPWQVALDGHALDVHGLDSSAWSLHAACLFHRCLALHGGCSVVHSIPACYEQRSRTEISCMGEAHVQPCTAITQGFRRHQGGFTEALCDKPSCLQAVKRLRGLCTEHHPWVCART